MVPLIAAELGFEPSESGEPDVLEFRLRRRGGPLTPATVPDPRCDSANSATFPTTRVRFPALGHARYAGTSRSAVNPCRRTTPSSLLAFIAAHAPYDKQPHDCDDCQPPRS